MSKSLRIVLSILVPLFANIIFLVFSVYYISICELKMYPQESNQKLIYLYAFWAFFQIIIITIVLIRSKHRIQLIPLPIISALFIALLVSWSIEGFNEQEEFDIVTWTEKPYMRINYAEDIISNGLLEDKCYDEIIEMLGEPDVSEKSRLTYEMGFGKLFIQLNDSCFANVNVKCR
jgi:hypothetical protein